MNNYYYDKIDCNIMEVLYYHYAINIRIWNNMEITKLFNKFTKFNFI